MTKLNLPPRTCARDGCDVELQRGPKESPSNWRRRKFCSTTCRQAIGRGRKDRESEPVAFVSAVSLVQWPQLPACAALPGEPWWTDNATSDELDRLTGLARTFCAGCPTRALCLEQGTRERFGLFGGHLWHGGSERHVVDLLASVAEPVAS